MVLAALAKRVLMGFLTSSTGNMGRSKSDRGPNFGDLPKCIGYCIKYYMFSVLFYLDRHENTNNSDITYGSSPSRWKAQAR